MGRYIVLSDRLTLGDRGDTVDIDETAVNVDALIAAGHVRPAPPAKPKAATKKGDS